MSGKREVMSHKGEVRDSRDHVLNIGDEVCFISAPNFLQVGTITGFKQCSNKLTLVEIVVDIPGKASQTATVGSMLCVRMSKAPSSA